MARNFDIGEDAFIRGWARYPTIRADIDTDLIRQRGSVSLKRLAYLHRVAGRYARLLAARKA